MRLTSSSTGLRKGAWTEEEDALLRNAIAKFGEGKWHKVPARAALNRCRKSCRLRWLNYLRPDIKRGNFSADEIDLILRLHKLLGNRWSLIAGRLPGRTANDVKNYWNTHLFKKSAAGKTPDTKQLRPAKNVTKTQVPTTNMNVVVKPKPMSFTSSVNWMNREEKESAGTGEPVGDVVPPAPVQFEKESSSGASNSMQFWLDNLFPDSAGQGKGGACSSAVPDGDILMLSPAGGGVSELQGGAAAPYSSFFPLESEFWDLLFSDD